MESDRIAMVNLSSAMGAQFAQVATEMTERIRKLGRTEPAAALAPGRGAGRSRR
jgi:coenzyme F420-reducing hydrogenase delta subunit